MKETINIGKFNNGKNNIADITDLPEGSLREALNVDITDDGSVRRRQSTKKVYSGINISSLFKRFFYENGYLKYLNKDNTASIIPVNIVGSNLTSCELNDELLFADEQKVFRSNGEILGLENPRDSLILSENSIGSLRKGDYQVSVLFIDPATGEMSGASNVQVINISDDNKGINILNIPQPERHDYNINIYISDVSSAQLYYHTTILNGVNSLTISNINQSRHTIPTLNMVRMSGGHIIRAFKGRLFVANDNVLYFSKPLRYGLFNPGYDFFYFADRITIVQPVDDGLYIVADKTYFLPGTSPEEAKLTVINLDTAIEGTGLNTNADNFNLENIRTGEVAYWFSSSGAVLGTKSGNLIQLSKDRLAVPSDIRKGSTTFIKDNGIHKFITTSNTGGGDSRSNIGAKDKATAVIIRNGVTI